VGVGCSREGPWRRGGVGTVWLVSWQQPPASMGHRGVLQEALVGKVCNGFGSSAKDGGVVPACREGQGEGYHEGAFAKVVMPSFKISWRQSQM